VGIAACMNNGFSTIPKAPSTAAKGSGATKANNANSTKSNSSNANEALGKAQVQPKFQTTINTTNHPAVQEDHQHPAPASQLVPSALQGDPSGIRTSLHPQGGYPSVTRTSLRSQGDPLRAQPSAEPAQPLRATASSISSFFLPAKAAKQGEWLTVPIRTLQSDSNGLLPGDEERAGLLKFLVRHNIDIKTAKEVALQIEACSDPSRAHVPMFSPQIFDEPPRFQIWSKLLSL